MQHSKQTSNEVKSIVFIEDEAALQKTLGETLRKEGFEVHSALDGELGLRLVQEKKPDLVLLDLILPKMNGFEVLSALKQGEDTKDIKVVVLTNLEGLQEVQRAIEMGATTYLVKSNYNLQEIIQKIKEILAQ